MGRFVVLCGSDNNRGGRKLPKATILVVDDNVEILTLLRLYLEREGFEVITADNCHAASKILVELTPDIIITDILLPKITGLQFIRWVRQQERLARVPIIAMSAYGKTQRGAAAVAGADRVLDKPDDFDSLVSTIDEMIANKTAEKTEPTITEG
jgi:two-component system alkaline phosphatase synthesis response regulator PhoP